MAHSISALGSSPSARLHALRLALFGVLAVPAIHAFPPAPFNTLYGMVRDDSGNTLRVEGAQIVFYRDGAEKLREPLTETSRLDQNYEIRLRMDMLRLGTRTYTSLAHSTGSTFTLGVVLNDIVYFPIEMSSPQTVGRPGERVRLDLTIGVDSDGDGIPDAWEQSQLYAGGIAPGPDGWDLSLMTRDGDFDGDGISNWREYIAGTYATDATDYLALQIVGTGQAHSRLRFFAIHGKVYDLESSTDLATWTSAALYLRDPESTDSDDIANPPTPQASVQATDTDFLDLYAPTSASGRTFYRLKVR
jgi:hypothetical protein